MAIIFKLNGGGGAGAQFGFLERFGAFRHESILEQFREPILFPRNLAPAPPPEPAIVEALAPTPVSPPERVFSPSPSDSPEAAGLGFFDDIIDVFQDVAVGVGRTAARLLVPDPIENAIQVLFPDAGAQVFGSPLGLPQPAIVPPTFPVVISEAGATPPFFEGPPGTIGTVEGLFGDIFGPADIAGGGGFGGGLPPNIPANINDPNFGVVRDEPGIFDDLVRAAGDIFPELIPELFGGGVGGAIAGGIADIAIEHISSAPGLDTEGSVLDSEFTPEVTPMAGQSISVQEWEAKGRPSGFCLTREGRLTRRRRRRRRPLSQQAKDDLAWAKATFGAGKQFDAVVSRMRF